jgi:hypothetical protein
MIKFRAWIKTEKRHLPVSLIDFKDGRVMCEDLTKEGGIFDSERYPVYRYSEIVLEQYRCSVAPGVEVYDGDILSDGDELIGMTGIVKMRDGTVYIGEEPLQDFLPLDGDEINAIVCGHVHESEAIK